MGIAPVAVESKRTAKKKYQRNRMRPQKRDIYGTKRFGAESK